jgi:hypothetical protein
MLVLLLTLGLTQGPVAPAACGEVAGYQALALWAGEWDVVNAAGQAAGSSKIERSPDGCGLIEHWRGRAPSGAVNPGTGLHAFNRASQGWTHLWVDATGFTATLTGRVDSGRIVYERTSQQPGGLTRHHRMTLAPANNQVTQTGEHSDDAGKTWRRDFQLTYTRKAA